mgnify:CR=1 FL=1
MGINKREREREKNERRKQEERITKIAWAKCLKNALGDKRIIIH